MSTIQSESKITPQTLKPAREHLDDIGYFDLLSIPMVWEYREDQINNHLTEQEKTYIQKKVQTKLATLKEASETIQSKILTKERNRFLAERSARDCLKLFTEAHPKLLHTDEDVAFCFGEKGNISGRQKDTGPGLFFHLNNFLLNVSNHGGGRFRFSLYSKINGKFTLFACEDREEINITQSASIQKGAQLDHICSLPISTSYLGGTTGSIRTFQLLSKKMTPDAKKTGGKYSIPEPELREYYTRCESLRDSLVSCILDPKKDPKPTISAYMKHTESEHLALFFPGSSCQFWLSPNIARHLYKTITTRKETNADANLLAGKNNSGSTPDLLNAAIEILKKNKIVNNMKFDGFFISYDAGLKRINETNGFIVTLNGDDCHSLNGFLKMNLDFYPLATLNEGIQKFTNLVKAYQKVSVIGKIRGQRKAILLEIDKLKKAYQEEPKEEFPIPESTGLSSTSGHSSKFQDNKEQKNEYGIGIRETPVSNSSNFSLASSSSNSSSSMSASSLSTAFSSPQQNSSIHQGTLDTKEKKTMPGLTTTSSSSSSFSFLLSEALPSPQLGVLKDLGVNSANVKQESDLILNNDQTFFQSQQIYSLTPDRPSSALPSASSSPTLQEEQEPTTLPVMRKREG